MSIVNWDFDYAHSSVELTVLAPAVSKVRGSVHQVERQVDSRRARRDRAHTST